MIEDEITHHQYQGRMIKTSSERGMTYDFTDASQATSSCLHHHLSFTLTESVREAGLVVGIKNVVKEGLATVFVDTLCDFVSCGITETREERKEFTTERCCCLVPEDNGAD